MSHTGRILVIEDDPDFLNILKMTFARFVDRYEVDYVSTYDEGLEGVTSGNHDLYLTDYMLDHGNTGDSLVDEAARRDYPIIMLTALDDHKLHVRMTRAGAQACLRKDTINSETIHHLVQNALSRH